MSTDYLSTSGIVTIIVYFLAILLFFKLYANNKYQNDRDTAKLMSYALLFKLLAAIGFALVYEFYYNWHGDSYFYFRNATRLGNVLFDSPSTYFRVVFGLVNPENVHEIDPRLGYRPNFRDMGILAVHRYTSIFTVLGLKNYYLTVLVFNAFLFFINWKVFVFFRSLFPDKTKIIAAGILFIPSAVFWGTGIIKDSWTFSFTLLFIVYFYKIIFLRKFGILNLLKLFICAYILIELKPYILYSAIVSGFVWLGFSYLYLVKNHIIRVFVLPITIFFAGLGMLWTLSAVMGMVGGFYSDIDSMLERAVVTQQDLKQDYYEGAAFDIGDFEPTASSAASVTPAAIIAGLYRPFIWEAASPLMFFSGLENSVLLILTLFILLRAGPIFVFKEISKEPFLIFCIVFCLSIALGIGLSTSNFGALVRFKIPMLPFFFISLLWIWSNWKKEKRESRR